MGALKTGYGVMLGLLAFYVALPATIFGQGGTFSGRAAEAMGRTGEPAETITRADVEKARADLAAAMRGTIDANLQSPGGIPMKVRRIPADPKTKKPARYVFVSAEAKRDYIATLKTILAETIKALRAARTEKKGY